MASEQPRRRRRAQAPPSPTSMIVNFFLDADLGVAETALELAITLIARRRVLNQPPTVAGRRIPPGGFFVPLGSPTKVADFEQIPPGPPTPPAFAAEAAPAPAPPPAITRPYRQRAKRSDAGQPRKRAGEAQASVAAEAPAATAATAPKRRGRPPVDVPLPGTTANAAPLPELPPQDVPFDARELDPVEIA